MSRIYRKLNNLYPKFKLEKKQEQRNELVALLDELLRQDEITREDYTKLNNNMAKCLGIPTTLRYAVNRILKLATDELLGITRDFKRRGIAENEIDELNRLVGSGGEFDEDGNPILPKILSAIDA